MTTSQTSEFIKKLWHILERTDPEIIRWVNDGTGFEICASQRLESDVFPTYFNHRNIQSFIRQLNFYGFKKVKGLDGNSVFSHRHFLRNTPETLILIQRSTAKNIVVSHSRVSELEGEIIHLTHQVDYLTNQVAYMMSTMNQLLKNADSNTRQEKRSHEAAFAVVPAPFTALPDLFADFSKELGHSVPEWSKHEIHDSVRLFSTTERCLDSGEGFKSFVD